MPRIKIILKNLLISTIISVGFFIFLEGLFSLLGIGKLNKFTGWGFNPECCGDLRPNMEIFVKATSGPYLVETNSLGLRDSRAVNITPEKTRILAIGDSFTFGPYLANEETWPAYLEEEFEGRVEVLNAGVSDYSIDYEKAYLIEKGYKLKPDLVILQFFSNDITDLSEEKVKEREPLFKKAGFMKQTVNFLRDRSHLFAFMLEFKIKREESKKLSKIEEIQERDRKIKYFSEQEHPLFAKYEKEFAELVEFTKKKNLLLMVVIFPALEQIKNPSLNEPSKFISNLCLKYQLPCLDLQKSFLEVSNPKALFLLPRDTHLSRYGNQIAAGEIKKFIEENELLN